MKRAALASTLLVAFGIAFANPEIKQSRTNVSWIVFACDEADKGDKVAQGFCKGFVEGVYSSMSEWCVPQDVTRGQLQELVVADLRIWEKSGEKNLAASEAIVEIISRRWPCE